MWQWHHVVIVIGCGNTWVQFLLYHFGRITHCAHAHLLLLSSMWSLCFRLLFSKYWIQRAIAYVVQSLTWWSRMQFCIVQNVFEHRITCCFTLIIPEFMSLFVIAWKWLCWTFPISNTWLLVISFYFMLIACWTQNSCIDFLLLRMVKCIDLFCHTFFTFSNESALCIIHLVLNRAIGLMARCPSNLKLMIINNLRYALGDGISSVWMTLNVDEWANEGGKRDTKSCFMSLLCFELNNSN